VIRASQWRPSSEYLFLRVIVTRRYLEKINASAFVSVGASDFYKLLKVMYNNAFTLELGVLKKTIEKV